MSQRKRRLSNSLFTAWLEAGRAHACEQLSHAILDAIYEVEVIWRTKRRSRRRRVRYQALRIIPNVRNADPRHDYLRHCPYCGHAVREVVLPRRRGLPSLRTLKIPEQLPEDL